MKHSVNSESAHAASGAGEVRQRIAVRVYELHRERGAIDGYDFDDWLKAEQAILGHEAKPESLVTSVL